MEKSILLHCVSLEEFEIIVKRAVSEALYFKYKVEEKNDNDYLLTRDEACKLLKISKTSLWKWSKNGRIKSYGIGNRVYYKKEELIKSLTLLNE